jgi:uncharacterized protein (TIGR02147 family)
VALEILLEKDYREILRREYELRAKKNPRYSLRAFSKLLGIASSRLSEILSEKQGLSRAWALQIAERLNYNEAEKQIFSDLVEFEHARNPLDRKLAEARLASRRQAKENPLQLDAFQAVSDWYHFAIKELALTHGFKSDPIWIAKKLGIPPLAAHEAIERLIRLGFLFRDPDGQLKADPVRLTAADGIASGVASEAIRKFHSQVLAKASEAIYSQNKKERGVSTLLVPFHADHYPAAEKMLREFRATFSSKFDPDAQKDSVYCLAMQFFRLDQKVEGRA